MNWFTPRISSSGRRRTSYLRGAEDVDAEGNGRLKERLPKILINDAAVQILKK